MNNVSTSSTGKYTNSSTYVSASDSMSGVECIYMKTPGSSSYGNMGTSTTVSSSGMNGLYSFYAKDKAGNTSRTYFLYLDTVNPQERLRTVTVRKLREVTRIRRFPIRQRTAGAESVICSIKSRAVRLG